MATPRGHPGTLKKGTAYSIVNQLEEDADRIEAALPAEDRDPDAETGPAPNLKVVEGR